MIKKLILFSFLILSHFLIYSQEYFQQGVKYTINVTLDDSLHYLKAFEKIIYKNNSLNTLNEIYFHLYPNAYKNRETALVEQQLSQNNTSLYYAKENERGWIEGMNFSVNNASVEFKFDKKNIDVGIIVLNSPLQSGDSIEITTPFYVKIPDAKFSRFGHDEQSYYITQWYPKPAVYDKYGWHAFPYLDQGEFYSEYGDYEVFITLPKNYVVGATGTLINADERKWLDERVLITSNKKEFRYNDLAFPPSDKATKTIYYKQNNVVDFAWFADKRFNVQKSSVVLQGSKKRVITWAFFTNEDAYNWLKVPFFINDAIKYYSSWIGDYQYDECSAVQGYATNGGMEYPMITLIGKQSSSFMLEEVVMHEVGHNWFYGMLGTNEREHPWMDEGINTFYELRYIKTKYPNAKIASLFTDVGNMDIARKLSKFFGVTRFPERMVYELMYLFPARNNEDQPGNLSSEKYSSMNYASIVYAKNAMSFNYLMQYLGQEKFDTIMHTYFNKWNSKHPYPDDLISIFESETKKDLKWMFDDLVGTSKKLDYKLTGFKKNKNNPDSGTITIRNKGKVISPVCINGCNKDSTLNNLWVDGFKGKKKISVLSSGIKKFVVDANYFSPDIWRKNNSIKTSSAAKKCKPLRLQFLASINDPDKTQIFFTPTMGWNYYNGYMLGMAFYSNPIFPFKWDYLLMPMYAFGSKNLSGNFSIGYNIKPYSSKIQNLRIGLSLSQYDYARTPYRMRYNRIIPQLTFSFKNPDPTKNISHIFNIRSVNIFEQSYDYVQVDTGYQMVKTDELYYFNDITYSFVNSRPINPLSFTLDAQQGDKTVKASAEINYKLTYKKKKGFEIRFFAGGFLLKPDNSNIDCRYRLDGTSGYNDYLFDYTYLGRSEFKGFLSQQFVDNEGGFKINTPIGQSWDWLIALNLKTSFPWKLPFKAYANLGTFSGAGNGIMSKHKIQYEAGFEIFIIDGIIEVYFPLLLSPDIKDAATLNYTNYWQKIRFTFNFDKANPLTLIKKIEMF